MNQYLKYFCLEIFRNTKVALVFDVNVDKLNELNADELNSVLDDPIKIEENRRLPIFFENHRDTVH